MDDKKTAKDKDRDDTERLRAQAEVLLSQARSQSSEIHRALSQASGNPALRARLEALAAHIDSVVAELSGAVSARSFSLRMADLMSLQNAVASGEVHAALSEAAGHAATASGVATPAQLAEVASSSTETRREVETISRDIFDHHIFDRYLKFSSPEDEAAFRKREADDKQYIREQLAKNTPEGNLNASGGTISYMLDAHAHGAGDSPQFMPRWNALVAKTERQYAAMKAAGQSTKEFDQHVTEGVRRFLKDEKHLPDAEIDRRMATSTNPLATAKSLLKDDLGSHHLENKLELNAKPDAAHQSVPRVVASTEAAMPAPQPTSQLDAVRAKLKAAGVKMADNHEAAPAHGVNVAKPDGKSGQTLAG